MIHKLFENSQRLIYQVAQNFIKPEFLENSFDFNFENEEIRQALENICVGPDCKSFLETQSFEFKQEIKLNRGSGNV